MIGLPEFKFGKFERFFFSLDDSPFEHDADRSKSQDRLGSSLIQLFISLRLLSLHLVYAFSVESVREIAAINRTHDVPFNRRWTKILTRFLLSSSKKHK